MVEPPTSGEEAELLERLCGKIIRISVDDLRSAALAAIAPTPATEEAPAGVETSDSDTGSW